VSAIVQRPEVEDTQLDAVFWIACAIGAALAATAYVTAAPLAQFYGLPKLEGVLRQLAVLPLLRGLTVVHESLLARSLDFRHLAIRANASVLCGAAVGIAAAVWNPGPSALVTQAIVRALVGAVVFWWSCAWRPRLRFTISAAYPLTSFSLKSFPATGFEFLTTQAEPFIIGKSLGATAVGVYRLATRVIDLLFVLLTRALWYVSFPYLSHAKDDRAELSQRLRTCLRLACLAAWPTFAVLAFEAHYVTALLGPRWAGIAPVLQLLCVYGAFRASSSFVGPLLLALGRPITSSTIAAVQCAALYACIGVAISTTYWSMEPVTRVAWARSLVWLVIVSPMALWMSARATGLRIGDLTSAFLPGALVTAIVVAAEVSLRWAMGPNASTVPALMGRVFASTAAAAVAVGLARGGGISVVSLLTARKTKRA
jgi:O-antigen/teichoic acid export membrane protein